MSRPSSSEHRRLPLRAAFLFVQFFLIITAYYQLKPASRSLFLEHLGVEQLPYVWVGTALVLAVAMLPYHRLVARHRRDRVVAWTCVLFIVLLLGFRVLLRQPGAAVSVAFYIYVDILSVVLVEQFWSLTNSLYDTEQGKRWYGLVGTGGLVGGVAGGALAAALIHYTPVQTPDLLLVAAGILGLVLLNTVAMGAAGLDGESATVPSAKDARAGWRALRSSRYLVLIAGILLLAQLAEPVVEYQFLHIVEDAYPERESRTAFLSAFFSVLGLVSIGVNLLLTPLVHRVLGVIAGLMFQPLLLAAATSVFIVQPTLGMAAAMKISDRGLSYSINRASKELLYVPIRPVLVYQAKAWIDMFGYRLFKVLGSVLILVFTQWLPWSLGSAGLAGLTLVICGAWARMVYNLRCDYRSLAQTAGSGIPMVRVNGC